jgi:hypothetical protein
MLARLDSRNRLTGLSLSWQATRVMVSNGLRWALAALAPSVNAFGIRSGYASCLRWRW